MRVLNWSKAAYLCILSITIDKIINIRQTLINLSKIIIRITMKSQLFYKNPKYNPYSQPPLNHHTPSSTIRNVTKTTLKIQPTTATTKPIHIKQNRTNPTRIARSLEPRIIKLRILKQETLEFNPTSNRWIRIINELSWIAYKWNNRISKEINVFDEWSW